MTRLVRQKIMLIFISLTLIIAFAGFLIANRSLAWFAASREVEAKGFSVSAKVSPNLIIGRSVAELTQEKVLFSVDFKGTKRTDMIAVTHDNNAGNTNLKYLYNHYAVGHATGIANPGATLDFENVPETDNEQYFIDYVVYIASAFGALEASGLKATIVVPEAVDSLPSHFMAASVDFYVGSVTDENYRGTAAVADAVTNPERRSVELLADGGETIPLNTDGYLTVTMRCYFDGALTTPDGSKAYINSYEAKTDGVVIGVEFVAVDKAA